MEYKTELNICHFHGAESSLLFFCSHNFHLILRESQINCGAFQYIGFVFQMHFKAKVKSKNEMLNLIEIIGNFAFRGKLHQEEFLGKSSV